MALQILSAKGVSAWKKAYMMYDFFVARRLVSTFFTGFFFSVLLPAKVLFFPEVEIPAWGMIYVPTATTLLNSLGTTPGSMIHLVIPWVTFENAMALHRCKAILIGLFEAGRANEWIITHKSGASAGTNVLQARLIKQPDTCCCPKQHRFHCTELLMGVFLLVSACYGCMYGNGYFYLFALPQSTMYLAIGFQLLGVN